MTCVHSPASPDATGTPSRGPLAPEDWGEVESIAPLVSPRLLPAFINGCSLFIPVSSVWLWYHCTFLRFSGKSSPDSSRAWSCRQNSLAQPHKILPSPPCCSGGWKFLMKVSILTPETVSAGTPGPGSDTAVQKYCRAWSWGQKQWIESKLYY